MTTTVAVVQLFLVVVAGVIEVDDNDNGAFGVRRGFEVEANVLGGDAQMTINRYVRRVLVSASSLSCFVRGDIVRCKLFDES